MFCRLSDRHGISLVLFKHWKMWSRHLSFIPARVWYSSLIYTLMIHFFLSRLPLSNAYLHLIYIFKCVFVAVGPILSETNKPSDLNSSCSVAACIVTFQNLIGYDGVHCIAVIVRPGIGAKHYPLHCNTALFQCHTDCSCWLHSIVPTAKMRKHTVSEHSVNWQIWLWFFALHYVAHTEDGFNQLLCGKSFGCVLSKK